MRKKYALERSGRGRFFFSKPVGPGLDVKVIVQKFANQKAWWNFLSELKEVLKWREELLTAERGQLLKMQ